MANATICTLQIVRITDMISTKIHHVFGWFRKKTTWKNFWFNFYKVFHLFWLIAKG